MVKSILRGVVVGLLALAAPSAFAAQELAVEIDQSRMMTLPTVPGAIIIGNPSIADVSIQGQNLFIHGRGFGQTNLTILDLEGNQIAYFELVGVHNSSSPVSIFKSLPGSTDRFTFSCLTLCETDIQVGDEPVYVSKLLENAQRKLEFATGSKTAEAAAPTAPQ
jgi:Pilus formation protein N terminal region